MKRPLDGAIAEAEKKGIIGEPFEEPFVDTGRGRDVQAESAGKSVEKEGGKRRRNESDEEYAVDHQEELEDEEEEKTGPKGSRANVKRAARRVVFRKKL